MPTGNFQIVGKIGDSETIAVRHSIRVLDFLQKTYGHGRWRKLKGVATVRLEDGRMRLAEVHWIGSTRHRQTPDEDQTLSRLNDMKHEETGSLIAICIDNTDYEMSLERRKVYPVLPGTDAARSNYVRVIDETGEDYLFPASRFILVPVTRDVEAAVLAETHI